MKSIGKYLGFLVILVACGKGEVPSGPSPVSEPPVDVTQEAATILAFEDVAEDALAQFRVDLSDAELDDRTPDFESVQEELDQVVADQEAVGKDLGPKKQQALEATYAQVEKARQGRLLEVRGRRFLFLLSQWQDLFSDLRAVSGKSIEEDAHLGVGAEPLKPEELERLREQLRQEFKDNLTFVGLHWKVLEEAAADPLLKNRLFIFPEGVTDKEKLSERLEELGEEKSEFFLLLDAMNAFHAFDNPYYFSLGAMEYFPQAYREAANADMNAWRDKLQGVGKKLQLQRPLNSFESLAQLFD